MHNIITKCDMGREGLLVGKKISFHVLFEWPLTIQFTFSGITVRISKKDEGEMNIVEKLHNVKKIKKKHFRLKNFLSLFCIATHRRHLIMGKKICTNWPRASIL